MWLNATNFNEVSGTPSFRLARNLKEDIREWNKGVYGRVGVKKKELMNEFGGEGGEQSPPQISGSSCEIEGILPAFVLGGSELEVKSEGIVFNFVLEKQQILDATLVANEVGF